ncbi:hypothetical protein [Sphingobium sp. WCS2017Hpa-17]|uniref:hypothetical protein n=1 Tax=Sphingobium sp. WCS2017Hpa-17 TaxID=3073638 RepID=UPI00288AD2C5|nr:hypothetical protein [Sphingobium sp. WCS2017Hpa-17]
MTLLDLQRLGQEFDGESVNPFYAAFLRSVGLPETIHAARAYCRAKSNADFMAFIGRAAKSAPPEAHDGQRVIDKAAWAAHVDAHGWAEFHDRFKSCDACEKLLCSCSDAEWNGSIFSHVDIAAGFSPVAEGE